MSAARVMLVIVGLACVADLARAEDKVVARQAYLDGSKYYDLNQFADALEAFKRAYWNYEDPAILFNIAQCHRALGHKVDAAAFYRSYLRKSPGATNRSDVEKILADLDGTIARENALSSGPPRGTIAAQTSPPSTAPPALSESPARVTPRPPAPKPQPAVAAVVVAATPTARPAKSDKPAWKRGWVWGVVAGVVVVGVAVGVGVGVGAQSHPPKPTDGAVSF